MSYILVIDDEEELRDLMVEVLKDAGYTARGAGPIEGLTQALRMTPELILLDVMMPEMDGPALKNELERHISTSNVPLIIVTAWHDPEVWFAPLKPAGILPKPFEIKLLVEMVKTVLARKE